MIGGAGEQRVRRSRRQTGNLGRHKVEGQLAAIYGSQELAGEQKLELDDGIVVSRVHLNPGSAAPWE
jgi:hypothetical protein